MEMITQCSIMFYVICLYGYRSCESAEYKNRVNLTLPNQVVFASGNNVIEISVTGSINGNGSQDTSNTKIQDNSEHIAFAEGQKLNFNCIITSQLYKPYWILKRGNITILKNERLGYIATIETTLQRIHNNSILSCMVSHHSNQTYLVYAYNFTLVLKENNTIQTSIASTPYSPPPTSPPIILTSTTVPIPTNIPTLTFIPTPTTIIIPFSTKIPTPPSPPPLPPQPSRSPPPSTISAVVVVVLILVAIFIFAYRKFTKRKRDQRAPTANTPEAVYATPQVIYADLQLRQAQGRPPNRALEQSHYAQIMGVLSQRDN